jgi:hypothetical protein
MSLINCVTFTPNSRIYTQGQYLSNNKYRERIVLTPQEYSDTLSFIRKILSQKSEIKFGKKVYLGSSSSLPRHKVKEYFTSNNTKKTSRIEQADTVIIDKGSVEMLREFLTLSDRNISIKLYKTYIADDVENKQKLTQITAKFYGDKISPLILIHKTDIPFYIVTLANSTILPELHPYLKNLKLQDLYITDSWSKNVEAINTYKTVEALIKNPHINILFDEDVLPIINSDGFDLDPAYLDTLDSMFESKTQENIDLALEMLSNVDLEKHALTLALFLNKHMDKFFKGSGLNVYQNRSFKSFIKYFDSKKIPFRSNWKEFSVGLLREYKNDPEKIEIINNFILRNINNFLRTVGEKKLSSWIEIESVNIKLK